MQKTGYCFIRLVINKFITSFYTWRNRVRSYGRDERLEQYEEKSTRTVLRGGNGGNAISLTRRWRRGKRFGIILVNLDPHKIVHLLPDREAVCVRRWLAAQPEVEFV